MKRSSPANLTGLGILGLVVGFGLDQVLLMLGSPVFVPGITLALTLLIVGVIVLVLSIPVRRALRGAGRAPLNPFRAVRIALLAQASGMVGALGVGFGLGVLGFLATRSVVGDPGSLWLAGATAAGSAIMLVLALIAEQFCALPPQDSEDDDVDDVPPPTFGGSHG